MMTKPVPKGDLEAELGSQFRLARERAGIRLDEMAAHLKFSINTVRWHEAGARMMRVDDVIRAARFMKVDPATLVRDYPEAATAATGEEAAATKGPTLSVTTSRRG